MIILLASCSAPAGDSAGSATPETVPTLPELPPPASQAQWSAADIEAALAAALVDGFPEVGHVHAAYLALLSHGDDVCPGHETYIDDTWLYGCTAESGYWFSGVSEYRTESTSDYDALLINGDFRFESPDAQRFSAGGHTLTATGTFDNEPGTIQSISGSWLWEGDPAASWLAGGMSGALDILLGSRSGSERITLDGALSFNGVSLDFVALSLLRACDWQATGVMSVRDPTGIWIRLDYGEACSACAEGSWGETSIGEVCPDLGPIVETATPYLKSQ